MIPLWIVYALISAILMSVRDIIAKKLLNKKIITSHHAVVQEYLSYFFITLLLASMIDFRAIIEHWPLFILKTLFIGSTSYIYFNLLEKHSISLVAPLLNISPAFLILLSIVFLNEIPTVLQVIGIILIIIATYYLEVVLGHHSTQKAGRKHLINIKKQDIYFFGTVFAMLTTISLTAIVDRKLLAQVNWQTNLFFISIIILITWTIMRKPKIISSSLKTFAKHPLSVAFGVLQAISTMFILLALTIPTTLTTLVITLRRTSTLFTSIFGGLLFHEDHLVKKVSCVLVMLLGIVLIAL